MYHSHYVPGYLEVPANEMLPEGMKPEKTISLYVTKSITFRMGLKTNRISYKLNPFGGIETDQR